MDSVTSDDQGFGSCSTSNIIPPIVGTFYLCVSALFLIGMSVWAASTFEESFFYAESKIEWMKQWAKHTMEKRSCYFPAITQIFDQVTDIGSIIEFYFLSRGESKLNTSTFDFCGGVNTYYLFGASVVAFVSYRIVSSVMLIYQHKCKCSLVLRVILQFLFDGELFAAIKTNWQTKTTEPSNPQIMVCKTAYQTNPFILLLLVLHMVEIV